MGINSEELHRQAAQERSERFEEKWLAKFKSKFGDEFSFDENLNAWIIESQSYKLAFYTKDNRVFDYMNNEWTPKGLKFLIKKFKLADM